MYGTSARSRAIGSLNSQAEADQAFWIRIYPDISPTSLAPAFLPTTEKWSEEDEVIAARMQVDVLPGNRNDDTNAIRRMHYLCLSKPTSRPFPILTRLHVCLHPYAPPLPSPSDISVSAFPGLSSVSSSATASCFKRRSLRYLFSPELSSTNFALIHGRSSRST